MLNFKYKINSPIKRGEWGQSAQILYKSKQENKKNELNLAFKLSMFNSFSSIWRSSYRFLILGKIVLVIQNYCIVDIFLLTFLHYILFNFLIIIPSYLVFLLICL